MIFQPSMDVSIDLFQYNETQSCIEFVSTVMRTQAHTNHLLMSKYYLKSLLLNKALHYICFPFKIDTKKRQQNSCTLRKMCY